MNLEVLMFFLALSVSSAFASPSDLDVLKAVVTSDGAAQISSQMSANGFNELTKIEKVGDPRCAGCAQYMMTFGTFINGQNAEKTAVLNVSQDNSGGIHVNTQPSQ